MKHLRHYRQRALAASALVAGVAAIGAGCSVSIGDTTLDTDKLESEIRSSVQERLEESGISVDCPSDIDAEEGDVFRCTLTTPGGEKREVVVRQTDDDGNVRWEVEGP
ncbi:MAG: DUF4333 domain-containing protein [Miltoncostaeaceae bacterium]